MEEAVCADDASPVGGWHAGQVSEPPAGLLDDDLERGEVPQRYLGLSGDIDGPLGDEHVRPEIAERAGSPRRLRHGHEAVQQARLRPAANARVGERRVRQAAYPGYLQASGL